VQTGVVSEFDDEAKYCSECGSTLATGASSSHLRMNKSAEYVPMAVAHNYINAYEAYIARGLLEAHGISAMVEDDNIGGLNWLVSSAVSGVKVLVPEKDLKRSQEIIEETLSQDEEPAEDEDPPEDQEDMEDLSEERCPRCGSTWVTPWLKVKRREGSSPSKILLMLFKRNLLYCDNCKHVWKMKKRND